jgi:hypothetical protein|tara:strand:+ start:23 stop:775 length:753 start_codon:yes stop_codon:yes gene_type:complete
MFKNIIEFSTHEDLLEDKLLQPIPAKQDIPNWYKNLEKHSINNFSIKGCIPVRDMIMGGYLLKLPITMMIDFNKFNPEINKKDVFVKYGRIENMEKEKLMEYNINFDNSAHATEQLGDESPHIKRNKFFAVPKILNPFLIKTPPGYSCLFIPPQHRSRDYFEILPAIVDTDKYFNFINFPYTWCGEKKENFNVVIKKGTPYVQVIPFKRENWKYILTKINQKKISKFNVRYNTNLLNIYLKNIWSKKTWN